MVTVRDWRDEDTDWWVGLRRRWDSSMSDRQLRIIASGSVGRFISRRVAMEEERPVGMGFVIEPLLPGWAATVLVEPQARGRGVGSVLWRDLAGAAQGAALLTILPDHEHHGLAVAQRWGFRAVSHGVTSRIELSGRLPEPNLPTGMRIQVISGADPAAATSGLDGLIAETGDFPEAHEVGWTVDQGAFTRMFADITWVLVKDAETVAAAASMSTLAGPGGSEWAVIFTGTRPAYRGRGLSRAAKQALHLLAFRRGATGLTTMNEADNTAIRALNATLGYRVVGGEVRMLRPATS
jgi:GNAT superfamily N-acetyltransferase